jgi:16S rRNA (cytidine1402-2'-O)-methyltransferase
MLYIISTPIGNLQDISTRVKETLCAVGVVFMESPADSKPLLHVLGIAGKKIFKYNEINSKRVLSQALELLRESDCAYISSAGTPGISDPGADLVRAARETGIEVRIIPGPSALVSAIAASGIRAREFSFVSFLPRKEGQLKKLLEKYRDMETVLVFFESPFRIVKTMKLLEVAAPNAFVCAAKEMTKLFENYFTGTPGEVVSMLEANAKNAKGEFTVVVDFSKRRHV